MKSAYTRRTTSFLMRAVATGSMLSMLGVGSAAAGSYYGGYSMPSQPKCGNAVHGCVKKVTYHVPVKKCYPKVVKVDRCQKPCYGNYNCNGCPVYQQPTYQNADIDVNANTTVHSEINAVSSNETNIAQAGGGSQNANVENNAVTNVESNINAGSANNVGVNQGGGGSWWGGNNQNANVEADANTHVNSEINAASVNNTNIAQAGGGGSNKCNWWNWGCGNNQGFQNATVDNNAQTTVHSTINAGSANGVNVNQN